MRRSPVFDLRSVLAMNHSWSETDRPGSVIIMIARAGARVIVYLACYSKRKQQSRIPLPSPIFTTIITTMKIDDSYESALVKHLCSRSGFKVCCIEPTLGRGKRADFVITAGSTRYMVELKTFQDVCLIWNDCIPGEVQSASARVEALPKIRKSFGNAMQQIAETQRAGITADFNVVWVNAHEAPMAINVVQTLYGLDCARELIDSNNNVEVMNVYFAYQSLFACDAFKGLDAVVLTHNFKMHNDCNNKFVLPIGRLFPGEGIVDVCINTFGERRAEFLASPLAKKAMHEIEQQTEDPSSPMADWFIVDPELEEENKKAVCVKDKLLARCTQGEISDDVAKYLVKKTGKRLGSSKEPTYRNYRTI